MGEVEPRAPLERVVLMCFHLGEAWVAVAAEDVADVMDGDHGRRRLRVDHAGGSAWIEVDRPVEVIEVRVDQLLPLSTALARDSTGPVMGFVNTGRGLLALLDPRRLVEDS